MKHQCSTEVKCLASLDEQRVNWHTVTCQLTIRRPYSPWC